MVFFFYKWLKSGASVWWEKIVFVSAYYVSGHLKKKVRLGMKTLPENDYRIDNNKNSSMSNNFKKRYQS